MARPEVAEAGGLVKVGFPAPETEATIRAAPFADVDRTTSDTGQKSPTRPVNLSPAPVDAKAEGRVREPLPNLAAIPEELEVQHECKKAQNWKAAEAEHAENNMSEAPQAGPLEIVNAERLPKKRPPRQLQRTRDYDYDR